MKLTWASTGLVEDIDTEGLETVGEVRVLVGGKKLGTETQVVLDDSVRVCEVEESVYIRNILTVKYLSGRVEHVDVNGLVCVLDLKDKLGDPNCKLICGGNYLEDDYPIIKVREPLYIITSSPSLGNNNNNMSNSVQLDNSGKPRNVNSLLDELVLLRREITRLESILGVASELLPPSAKENKMEYAIKEIVVLQEIVRYMRGQIQTVDTYHSWWHWAFSWFW